MKKVTSKGIIGSLYLALRQNPGASWVNAISAYIESDQETEEYGFLGMVPTMQEWKGRRQAKGIREDSWTIKNKLFESTLEIPVDWVRRDKTGQVQMRINQQAKRASTHWASLVSQLIQNAESNACYDGQFFFDTDHEEGKSGVQSNDITVDISAVPVTNHGIVTAPSVGEMVEAILRGCQQILGFKDDQGEPLNEDLSDFLVMVPTSFWKVAAAALGNPNIDSGDTNTIAASMDGFNISMSVNPRLTWTDKFSIFAKDQSVPAFIRQDEYGVKVGAVAEGSELEFNDKVHHYGIEASRNAGYGFWQGSTLVTLI